MASNEEVDTQGWQRGLIKALQKLTDNSYALAA